MSKARVSHERLLELLDYNPETGVFTWKVQRGGPAQIGAVAGNVRGDDKLGYVTICVEWRIYKAHNLAWFYMTGEWPENEIDHKNLVKSDNSFANLRPATRRQNMMNLRPKSTKASKWKGVYYEPDRRLCWRMIFTTPGRQENTKGIRG